MQDEVKKSPKEIAEEVLDRWIKWRDSHLARHGQFPSGDFVRLEMRIEAAIERERQAARPNVVGESVVEAEAFARYGVPQGEGLGELWYRNKCAFKEGAMWILALNARAALAELWPSEEEFCKIGSNCFGHDISPINFQGFFHTLKARVLGGEGR